jgi:hypothetical protein
MLAQIDAICEETGVWPHAVLSGHAHNYQRFTRVRQAMQSTQNSPLWARTSERFRCQATCIVNWSSTRTEPSRRRSSTSDAQEITCLTKSRAFVLATETATERTTYSTRFATASRWLSGIAKASDLSLLFALSRPRFLLVKRARRPSAQMSKINNLRSGRRTEIAQKVPILGRT